MVWSNHENNFCYVSWNMIDSIFLYFHFHFIIILIIFYSKKKVITTEKPGGYYPARRLSWLEHYLLVMKHNVVHVLQNTKTLFSQKHSGRTIQHKGLNLITSSGCVVYSLIWSLSLPALETGVIWHFISFTPYYTFISQMQYIQLVTVRMV